MFNLFYTGDIVGLGWLNADNKAKDIASGIVSRVTETAVTVAFDETADSLAFDDDGPFKLVKLANDVTHKRIKRCLCVSICCGLKILKLFCIFFFFSVFKMSLTIMI